MREDGRDHWGGTGTRRDDLTETIIETHRDVKWICRTLKEMDARDEDFETRLRTIEGWQHRKIGEEQRTRRIGASTGGLMGGVVAVIMQFLWGG